MNISNGRFVRPLRPCQCHSAQSFSYTPHTRTHTQWQPEHNENSAQHVVKPGDELFGSITYDPATHSYNVYHNSSDGWEVNMPIKIQKGAGGEYKSA